MGRPNYFVILAAMRTGSNFLERTLNQVPGLVCHGELFNPGFVGKANATEFLGFDVAARDRDPDALIEAMIAAAGADVPGFRLFDGHDPRVLARVAADPDCARVVLTRDPVEVHVSLKIARATDQWMLGNVKRRREAQVAFVPAEFEAHRDRLLRHQARVGRMIRAAGQTAFAIDYAELKDLDLVNGLARHLGAAGSLTGITETIHRQNPGPVTAKLTNPAEYLAWAAGAAAVRAERSVPEHFSCRSLPLVFAPLPGAPRRAVLRWMASLDGGPVPEDIEAAVAAGRVLRQGGDPPGLVFTVLRDPLARARALCHGQPPDAVSAALSRAAEAAAEGGPLPGWESQTALLSRLAAWRVPRLVIAESWLPKGGALLKTLIGTEAGRNAHLKEPDPDLTDDAAPDLAGLAATLWPEDESLIAERAPPA